MTAIVFRISALALLLLPGLSAKPRLPAVIGDHMVLERGRDLPIWGWADPEETITVSIAGQRHVTSADRQGRWKVTLSRLKAGGPLEMRVAGREELVVRDILVGDVWLCSGQSNMQFQLQGTTTASREIAAAKYPKIRLFTLPKESALDPREDTRSAWKICTPETAGDFSAVGYLFGKELHQKLGVPVGLIASSWGGTNAEEWTTPEYLRKDAGFAPILERWRRAPEAVKRLYRQPLDFDLWFDGFELLPRATGGSPRRIASFDNGKAETELGGSWSYDRSNATDRHRFELAQPGQAGSAWAARIHGELKVSDTSALSADYAAGARPVDLSSYTGLRFHVRGSGFFKVHSLQAGITDWDNHVSRPIQATEDWKAVTILFEDLRQAGWGKQLPFTASALSGLMIESLTGPSSPARPPSGLFNGMIRPLIPFAIRGAIWYQGEGNAGRAYQYRKLLPALIESWRYEWRQGDFPFLIVQLPNYKPRRADPGESAWAELREAQLMALSVPNTGLAVAIDAGVADDVHPRDKTLIGQRLALWALGSVYGKRGVYSGPLYSSMRREKGRIRLRFEHRGSGLVARGGGPLEGFAIAGSDSQFYWAEARIDGKTVVVSSLRVPDPVAVRYAWADNPECNLYNKEGLPASPFRTDDWPGVTMNAR